MIFVNRHSQLSLGFRILNRAGRPCNIYPASASFHQPIHICQMQDTPTYQDISGKFYQSSRPSLTLGRQRFIDFLPTVGYFTLQKPCNSKIGNNKFLRRHYSKVSHNDSVQDGRGSDHKSETNSGASNIGVNSLEEIPSYLHFHSSCTSETFKEITSTFKVVKNYLTLDEEEILLKELEPHLRRLNYEFDHWDDAIHGYRETERGRWSKAATPIISRMRESSFPCEKDLIGQIHVLDLAKAGVIKPHVDSIRFCGNIISGLCLLSDAVMRLVHTESKDQIVDILLPRRSLYIMRDESRYKYTHEVLGEMESIFGSIAVPRDRRISIICRNHPINEET